MSKLVTILLVLLILVWGFFGSLGLLSVLSNYLRSEKHSQETPTESRRFADFGYGFQYQV